MTEVILADAGSPARSTIQREWGGHELTISPHGTVRVDGKVIVLTPMELNLLLALIGHSGKIMTKRMQLAALYGSDDQPGVKILDVFACKLRAKIGANFIETVWGRGYKFNALTPDPIPVPAKTTKDGKSAYVIGPNGARLTSEDLPEHDGRWVISQKAKVVKLVEGGVVSLAEVLAHYPDMTPEEFSEWQGGIDQYGLQGIRATRVQQYL